MFIPEYIQAFAWRQHPNGDSPHPPDCNAPSRRAGHHSTPGCLAEAGRPGPGLQQQWWYRTDWLCCSPAPPAQRSPGRAGHAASPPSPLSPPRVRETLSLCHLIVHDGLVFDISVSDFPLKINYTLKLYETIFLEVIIDLCHLWHDSLLIFIISKFKLIVTKFNFCYTISAKMLWIGGDSIFPF